MVNLILEMELDYLALRNYLLYFKNTWKLNGKIKESFLKNKRKSKEIRVY